MSAGTYTVRAMVLRKTKLGETDLILTLLAEDGRQIKAVAKGARKPSSSFAARLDVFCEADVLLVRGKSLDIVKEARLIDAHRGVRQDMEHAAAAAPVVDLAARLCQPDLASPKLYALTSSALAHMEKADASTSLALCAAHMLKAFAFAGFRPSLDRCVVCGARIDLPGLIDARRPVAFSPAEGGAACPGCLLFSDARRIAADALIHADWLLRSTFADIAASQTGRRLTFEVLRICQDWIREHVGSRLKSLDFLFASGLF